MTFYKKMSDDITAAEAKGRGFDPATIRGYEAVDLARSEARLLIPLIESAFDGVHARPQTTLSVGPCL